MVFGILSIIQYQVSDQSLQLYLSCEIIDPDDDVNSIYFPIPKIPHMISSIEGNYSIEKVETEKGNAYSLTGKGNGNVLLKGEETRHVMIEKQIPNSYYDFTLEEDLLNNSLGQTKSYTNLWFYCEEGSNLTFHFNYSFTINEENSGPFARDCEIEGSLNNGWKLFQGDVHPGIHGDIGYFLSYNAVIYILWPTAIGVVTIIIIKIIISKRKSKKERMNL